jgi:predicted phosphodiesterase
MMCREEMMCWMVFSHFREKRGLLVARVITLAYSLTLVGLSNVNAQDRAFQFGLMGDTGYTTEDIEGFKRLLEAINSADLSFVVHVGDFENDGRAYTRNMSAGPMPCTDESFKAVYDSFQSIKHPFILTPGDNDWTDCHGVQARQFDPLELLTKVRAMFFPEGRSLGQRTMPVVSQAAAPQYGKFRENLRWSMGGVTFVTLHIVGSNDNFGRTPEMDAEHRERQAANISWLRKGFAEAKANDSRGLALLTQANPNFENYWPTGQKGTYLRMIPGARAPEKVEATGYDEYIKVLAEEMESYTHPAVFLHGDTHRFRVDQPLFSAKDNRRFENFTRVETFGSPDTHWIRVTVDPTDPQVFSFKAQIIPENVRARR